ncbi:MAG TPA: PAS domain S-box protein [Aquabacterium sp.]|nr:PAS domain S-box protein [Aquabacterium sp.]
MNVATDACAVQPLNELIQVFTDAALWVGEDGVIRCSNQAACCLFGYDHDDLMGRPIKCLIPAFPWVADQWIRQASLNTPAEKRSGDWFEARVSVSPLENGSVVITVIDRSTLGTDPNALRKCSMTLEQMARAVVNTETDGRIEYVNPLFFNSAVISPIRDAIGSITHYVAVMDDITERKSSEQEIALSEQRFRATFEQSAFGMAHVAPDGHWIRVNQKLCNILRYSHQELMQLVVQDLTHPDDVHSDMALMNQLVAGEVDHYSMEKRYIRKHGEPIWVKLTVSLVRMPQGQPNYFISVVEDIDARKRAEVELQHLRADMEQVLTSHVAIQTAAAIAHELNQPLNAIASYAEAALRLQAAGPRQSERVAYALRSASEQAQRAGRVIRELMQLLHKRETTTEPIDINGVVKDAIAIVQASRLCQFTTKIHLKADLGLVMANRLQVEKVLVNLLQNGIEAMKAAGISTRHITITVSTMEDDEMALISVQDHGPGLNTEAMNSVFQPFFTTKKNGLGMGLAVSRALIEAHGGKLWLDTKAEPGATFRFTLPLAT